MLWMQNLHTHIMHFEHSINCVATSTLISNMTDTELILSRDIRITPLFVFRRFSNSLKLSSSGAEHEPLEKKKKSTTRIVNHFITLSYEEAVLKCDIGSPAWIPNIFRTCPFGRKKSINWQFSPFRAIITLSPLFPPPGWQVENLLINNTGQNARGE